MVLTKEAFVKLMMKAKQKPKQIQKTQKKSPKPKTQEIDPKFKCAVDGCPTEKYGFSQWCEKHKAQMKRHGCIQPERKTICDCGSKDVYAKGLCLRCYFKYRRSTGKAKRKEACANER